MTTLPRTAGRRPLPGLRRPRARRSVAASAKICRRIRKRSAMSQAELAAAASLHRTEIGLIERGNRVVRIDTLIKLASALGVSPLLLLDGIFWTIGGSNPGNFSVTGAQAGGAGGRNR